MTESNSGTNVDQCLTESIIQFLEASCKEQQIFVLETEDTSSGSARVCKILEDLENQSASTSAYSDNLQSYLNIENRTFITCDNSNSKDKLLENTPVHSKLTVITFRDKQNINEDERKAIKNITEYIISRSHKVIFITSQRYAIEDNIRPLLSECCTAKFCELPYYFDDFGKSLTPKRYKEFFTSSLMNHGIKFLTDLLHIERFNDHNEFVKNVSMGLHIAADMGRPEEIAFLAQLDPGSINAVDEHNQTPLHKACIKGHDKVVTSLINYGADVNHKDDKGMTPLHYATDNEKKNLFKNLIKAGSNVNAKDNYEWSPLHKAARRNQKKIIAELLKPELGVEIDAGTIENQTALIIAASEGFKEIVKQLLFAGADINALDCSERGALHWAIAHNKKSTVKILIENEATIDLSVVDTALENGNRSIVEMLREKDNSLSQYIDADLEYNSYE